MKKLLRERTLVMLIVKLRGSSPQIEHLRDETKIAQLRETRALASAHSSRPPRLGLGDGRLMSTKTAAAHLHAVVAGRRTSDDLAAAHYTKTSECKRRR